MKDLIQRLVSSKLSNVYPSWMCIFIVAIFDAKFCIFVQGQGLESVNEVLMFNWLIVVDRFIYGVAYGKSYRDPQCSFSKHSYHLLRCFHITPLPLIIFLRLHKLGLKMRKMALCISNLDAEKIVDTTAESMIDEILHRTGVANGSLAICEFVMRCLQKVKVVISVTRCCISIEMRIATERSALWRLDCPSFPTLTLCTCQLWAYVWIQGTRSLENPRVSNHCSEVAMTFKSLGTDKLGYWAVARCSK